MSLGFAHTLVEDEEICDWLINIQSRLFDIGADLATPEAGAAEQAISYIHRAERAWVSELEQLIDNAENELTPLTSFILPGGSAGAAILHVARTVCRRAERRVISLSQQDDSLNPVIVEYLNRLSDLLFVLSRLENLRLDEPDVTWTGRY